VKQKIEPDGKRYDDLQAAVAEATRAECLEARLPRG